MSLWITAEGCSCVPEWNVWLRPHFQVNRHWSKQLISQTSQANRRACMYTHPSRVPHPCSRIMSNTLGAHCRWCSSCASVLTNTQLSIRGCAGHETGPLRNWAALHSANCNNQVPLSLKNAANAYNTSTPPAKSEMSRRLLTCLIT